MTNREYYDLIMRSSDGIATMSVFRKNGEKQIFRCTNPEEIERIVAEYREGCNTYLDPNLRRPDLPPGKRGGDEDVAVINCFAPDIDIRGPAHVEDALPETPEIAMKLLEGYPLPTLVVSSGYGLYPMWFFSEPIRIGDEQQREYVKAALTGFGNSIIRTFADAGYKLDNVFSIPRSKRLSTPWTARENCSSPSCPALLRRKAVPSLKM